MNASLGEVLQKERETTHKSTKNYVRALAYYNCVLDAEWIYYSGEQHVLS